MSGGRLVRPGSLFETCVEGVFETCVDGVFDAWKTFFAQGRRLKAFSMPRRRLGCMEGILMPGGAFNNATKAFFNVWKTLLVPGRRFDAWKRAY